MRRRNEDSFSPVTWTHIHVTLTEDLQRVTALRGEHGLILGDSPTNPGRWMLSFPPNVRAWHTGSSQQSRSCYYYYCIVILEENTKARVRKQVRVRSLVTPTTESK